MKIIYSWGHPREHIVKAEVKEWRDAGYDITSFNHKEKIGIEKKSWSHKEIYNKVKSYKNDEDLCRVYDEIRDLSENHDILIVNHTNVYHPDFIKSLKNIYTVIASADDPEGSDYCSKPYVHAFDHSFAWGVNFDKDTKITEKFLQWGAKRADWWPYGVREEDYDLSLTEEDIYNKNRDIEVVYVGSGGTKLERLAILKKAFPQKLKIYGRGYWKNIGYSGISALRRGNFPKGALKAIFGGLWRVEESPGGLVPLYQRCKIGLNMHQSFGPSNVRTYQLPANGVMQICDCQEGLDQVFEIGKEVVVYHSTDEAVELIKYYLEHEEERKEIAVAGFKRTMKDYKKWYTFSCAIERVKKGMIEDGITHFKDGTPIKYKDVLLMNMAEKQ